jgi:penicillin G amidase
MRALMSRSRTRGGLAAACALCTTLALASPASSSVIRATSLLPPGESGFVSLTGVATGTGSPHLYDQQQLFIAFDRKSAMFDQLGTEEDPIAGVKIIRDAFGVPSVTGVNADDLWWGAGYATAEDRLAELEIFRRATTGHLAEVAGASYLPMDIEVRRDFYTPAELSAMFETLSPAFQARYASYATGINAWVDHVNQSPGDMPAEFPALGITPTHFSVEDLVAIGVYLARTTPNTDGTDLLDMQALQQSGPAKFNRILPLRIARQISTIPSANGLFPSVPGRTLRQERQALARSYAFVRQLPVPAANDLGSEYVSGTDGRRPPPRRWRPPPTTGPTWPTRSPRSAAAAHRWSRSATPAPITHSCSAARSSASRRPRSSTRWSCTARASRSGEQRRRGRR